MIKRIKEYTEENGLTGLTIDIKPLSVGITVQVYDDKLMGLIDSGLGVDESRAQDLFDRLMTELLGEEEKRGHSNG